MTQSGGQRPAFPRRWLSPTRSSWPRGCSSGHLKRAYQQGGCSPIPSTAARTSSGRGWRSGGAPSTRRPLPEGESGRQTRSQRRASSRGSRRAEYHDALRRGSTAHRRRVADGRASLATQAARGTPLQRSPHGAGRDHVGGANGLLLARDARRVRQVGGCLPTLRAVVKAGSLAAHPRSVGRRGVTRTGDEVA
jgi:hypothetical protein